jgi:hypothetical protein
MHILTPRSLSSLATPVSKPLVSAAHCDISYTLGTKGVNGKECSSKYVKLSVDRSAKASAPGVAQANVLLSQKDAYRIKLSRASYHTNSSESSLHTRKGPTIRITITQYKITHHQRSTANGTLIVRRHVVLPHLPSLEA